MGGAASSAISRDGVSRKSGNAVRLAVRRQRRPGDKVAILPALIEGNRVRGHRERRLDAAGCAAVAE